MNPLNLRFKKARELRGTQAEVAVAIGVAPSTVSRWERGHGSIMHARAIFALLEALPLKSPEPPAPVSPALPAREPAAAPVPGVKTYRKLPGGGFILTPATGGEA